MFARSVIFTALTAVTFLGVAYGEESKPDDMMDMPMGAPEQMKELAYLEGDWQVDMQWQNMEDPSKWDEVRATCTYKYVLDGCAMECEFLSKDMMGLPFEGYQLMTFDRDRNKWQTIWLDTMGGKISFYTGERKDGKITMAGEEMWQGQEYLSRMTVFNETPTRFEWLMDNSYDGGKTWQTMGKAVYTKK